jgi:hypothetical protein
LLAYASGLFNAPLTRKFAPLNRIQRAFDPNVTRFWPESTPEKPLSDKAKLSCLKELKGWSKK